MTSRSAPQRDRGQRRGAPAEAIELLNVHWHGPRGGQGRRSCPLCGANVGEGDHAVHHAGELYHPAFAPDGRDRP